MAEKRPGRKACVKAAFLAPRSGRRALTRAASRPCCSTWGSALRLYALVRNIFDIFLLPQVPSIHRGRNLARIHETASLRRPVVARGHCSVPLDSPNVPKSTSRHFRHFKQLLRSFFEVKKKKDSLKGSNKCVVCGFYTNNVLVRS